MSNHILSAFLPSYNKLKEDINKGSKIIYCGYNQDKDQDQNKDLRIGVKSIDKYSKYSNEETSLQLSFFEFEDSIETKQKKKDQIKKEIKVRKEESQKENKEEERLTNLIKKQTFDSNKDYVLISEYNKQNLDKFKLDEGEKIEASTYINCGALYSFSLNYYKNKLSPLNPTGLNRTERKNFFSNCPTYEDEILSGADDEFNIVTSDRILSYLMTMNMTSRAWHVNIVKKNGILFFDIDKDSDLELINVNESDEIPLENDPNPINSFKSLACETTILNNDISEAVLDKEIKSYNDLPFKEYDEQSEENERKLYSYKKYMIGDMNVLVRCAVHCGTVFGNENKKSRKNEDNEEENEDDDEDDEDIVNTHNVYVLNEYNVSILYFIYLYTNNNRKNDSIT